MRKALITGGAGFIGSEHGARLSFLGPLAGTRFEKTFVRVG